MSGPPADEVARQRLSSALTGTAARDVGAFQQLHRLTAAKLFGICLRICGEQRAAEDVLQEVYLTVWNRAGRFDPTRGGAIAWLSSIARNRAIDWRRSNRAAGTEPIEAGAEIADDVPSARDRLLLDEEAQQLQHALEQLEPRARAAIRSAFFDGLTYVELAARADVPLGTMKSWVRRGLLRLRDELDER